MIEDPKLPRDILECFAQDDVGFPADVMVQRELAKAFPDHDLPTLQYHVMCAFEGGLLMGTFEREQLADGTQIRIGHIDGLTAKGGNYVRDSRTTLWGKAADKIRDAGLNVTTARLIDAIDFLASKALS